MHTERKLNMSCIVAAAKARRNSFRSVACPSEMSVDVDEVPMLAPMTMGMPWRTVSSCAATIAMKMELEMEDD